MSTLRSIQVMVTRPDPFGSELCTLIRKNGGHAIHFPTIAFAPPQDLIAYQQALATLDQQNWLIFISPQAVCASITTIRHSWPVFPPQVKFAAIGTGTVEALHAAGYVTAISPKTQWHSEGLLLLAEFQHIADQKIALIRGEGGRELLEATLTARGAKVTPVIAYQRILPNMNLDPYQAKIENNSIDVIVCTSYQGVQNLKILLGKINWSILQTIPLIVVSQRIKILAQDLGFQTIWVAPNARHESILQALRNYHDRTSCH